MTNKEYRTIAGYTTFLKIISKILTTRIREIMPTIINKNFPLSKVVVKKIDSLCRTFIWTGKDEISRKSHVA